MNPFTPTLIKIKHVLLITYKGFFFSNGMTYQTSMIGFDGVKPPRAHRDPGSREGRRCSFFSLWRKDPKAALEACEIGSNADGGRPARPASSGTAAGPCGPSGSELSEEGRRPAAPAEARAARSALEATVLGLQASSWVCSPPA